MAIGPRARVLLIAAVLFGALAALVWFLSYRYWSQPVTPLAPPAGSAERTPAPSSSASPSPAPSASPNSEPSLAPSPQPSASPAPTGSPSADASHGAANSADGTAQTSGDPLRGLLIPVAGVRAEQLQDTFDAARSEGRVHDAIDIIAPRNTPVLAAADGRVVRLFQSAKGGTTLYQLASADEHVVLYYAHLERYADGLAEGHFARRGETIAYVGDSGNATPGNTHLHFQIYRVADPKHFWTGDNINPYPLLRGAQ
ncbi:MAG TPA: M23 family metallopeptidase [Pyrinomonadaceae bacterium]|nr:M23 family metallopeptidase [Pyrinomonadaceae bacterium]